MELRQIRYFVATAEVLNFTRAAEQMNVAQPALSRQIRALEDDLGAQLLQRDSRQVSLTPAGQLFLEDAREILELIEAAEARVKRSQQNPPSLFSLGYAPSLAGPWLDRIIKSLSAQIPNTKVILRDMDNEEMIEAIRNQSIHAGLLPEQAIPRSDLFVFERVLPISFEVALPADHPLAKKEKLHLRDLAPECLIGYDRKLFPDYFDHLKTIYAQSSQALIVSLEVDSGSSILAMVRSGQGVSIVATTTRLLKPEGLAFRPLDPQPAPFDLCLVTHRDLPAKTLTQTSKATAAAFAPNAD